MMRYNLTQSVCRVIPFSILASFSAKRGFFLNSTYVLRAGERKRKK